MRAIIDARGLPEAVRYYRMFSREPSINRQLDMSIQSIDQVNSMSMETLLDRMLAVANRGEKEVLIVAHGEPRGFLMRMTAGATSAMQDALETVMRTATALDQVQAIGQRPAAERLAAWTRFIERLAPGTITGTITVQVAENWFAQRWLRGQVQNIRVQTAKLRELVRKMQDVRQQRFRRVEVRACNMGANVNALRTLREFLGAQRVLAPTVGTFYVPLHPFVPHHTRQLQAWSRRYGGPVRGGVYRGGAGPSARTFQVYVPARGNVPMGFAIPEGFRLRIWEVSRRPHRYAAAGAAAAWSFVRSWVGLYIMPGSAYRRGRFYLAGSWTFGRGRPYTLPLEPDYRNFIVSQP
jgi:hypothetical protein